MAGDFYPYADKNTGNDWPRIFYRIFSCFCNESASGEVEDNDETDAAEVQQDEPDKRH